MGIINRWLEAMTPSSSQKFFAMLKEQTVAANELALMLLGGVRDRTLGTPEFTALVHLHERKVDDLMDRIMYAVRQTMIHPVDPDDLRHVAYAIESTVDAMDHFVWRMEAYRLAASPAMDRMVSVIHEMTGELVTLFDLLLAKDFAGVLGKYHRLRELEEATDRLFHDAIKQLHQNGEKNYTVEHEVLAFLERCADKCMHVGRSVVVMLERNQ